MSIQQTKINELVERRAAAKLGGGQERIEAQMGIFGAYLLAMVMGFAPNEAGAIGVIGGADGPTAIFLSSKLAPDLMGSIAVCAYSYMALVPVIQKPRMLLSFLG